MSQSARMIDARPLVSFITTRFGEIQVQEGRTISFVSGMPGFEHLKRFIILDHDVKGMFKWLQSVEDPSVAFLMTDPAFHKPDYKVPLKKDVARLLGLKGTKDNLITFVMVTVSKGSKDLNLNLKGPVLFNFANMSAIQYIIDNDTLPSDFTIRSV